MWMQVCLKSRMKHCKNILNLVPQVQICLSRFTMQYFLVIKCILSCDRIAAKVQHATFGEVKVVMLIGACKKREVSQNACLMEAMFFSVAICLTEG